MENNTNEIVGSVTDPTEAVTGLSSNYPIILNGVSYQYFKTWNTKRNDHVTTHETEAGTQEDVTIRKGRKSISVSVTCLQPLLKGLIELAELDEFEAQIYDPVSDDYEEIIVRVGPNSMSYNLKQKSADLETVNGVWQVTFTLEEF